MPLSRDLIDRLPYVEGILNYLALGPGQGTLHRPLGLEDPTAPADVLPRESIELRTLVFHV
jgi:hypothetical protein